MPIFPIIDAHVHLWNPTLLPIPWLTHVPKLNQPYDLATYTRDTARVPIVGMVYIEVDVAPGEELAEAQLAVSYAATEPRLQGIVAAAPVERGQKIRRYLEALQSLSPLIKGVRRLIQQETDPQFCLRDDFIAGVQLLAEYDFSFELCLRHDQLPQVTELVRRCPATAFMLDHLGKPNVREHVFAPWGEHLAALAALPNVMCKLSGLVTEADQRHWTQEDLAPYLDHALRVFGPDRVVFGSDWPVVLLAASYPRWYDTLAGFTAYLPESAQRQIWAVNAQRFYRLSMAP